MSNVVAHLELDGDVPEGPLVIEASAGTGKTYSLSAIVVRHIAERGLLPTNLLVVTFTRSAVAELRDRTRQALVDARDACRSGVVPSGQAWMSTLVENTQQREVHRQRLDDAIASFDDATITTIHGFCQQALSQIGVRAGRHADSRMAEGTLSELIEQVCVDLVIAELATDPSTLSWKYGKSDQATPKQVLTQLQAVVTEILRSPNAHRLPTNDMRDVLADQHLDAWCHVVEEAVRQVRERRAARRELGYDDLITGLHEALHEDSERAEVNRAALRSRYHLVLVDESQDNDPLQWQIFEAAFADRMITVGDPKQAIYRFRGADVHSYLRFSHAQNTMHLATNYRSDAPLVTATNALLSGITLGHDDIAVHDVQAVDRVPESALVTDGDALQIRWLPRDGDKPYGTSTALPLVLADLTGVVRDLLSTRIVDDGVERDVHCGDIAVLVATKAEADQAMRALTAAGVPSVRTRTGSVYATPAVDEWRTLLYALARPGDAARARAAAVGVFFDRPTSSLVGDAADEVLAEVQATCSEWSALLERSTWLGWYDHVRTDSSLVLRLLQRPGGERLLTDLDHIAELLAGELVGGRTTPQLAQRRLEHLRASKSDSEEPGPDMRRIDSDARAVQISTVHSSKGLEYPIVLLPTLWTTRQARVVTVATDDHGHRVIDIATKFEWGKGDEPFGRPDDRKSRAAADSFGDQLRLLYVAVTRARHRTVLWWAPTKESGKSALASVLFARGDQHQPLNPRVGGVADLDDLATEQDLQRLASRSAGHLGVLRADQLDGAVVPPTELHDQPPGPLAVATGREVEERHWKRWSFTSITRATAGHGADAPVVGGADEPTALEDEITEPPVPSSPGRPTMPWADIGGGAAFGTLVHEVLERLDPTSPTLGADVDRLVRRQVARSGLDLDVAVLIEGLSAALHTPLGPVLGDRRLVDIGRPDTLAELRFDMPLVHDAAGLAARDIGSVLLDTLAANDPLRGYAAEVADGRFGQRLAGFLQGSIDAVYRVDIGGQQRFVVVDYKTNRLHGTTAADPLAAYSPDRLPAAMAHSDYPLQALLYSVALHRYLRWRLPHYDPSVHLGGIGYLFLRGMVGPTTPVAEGCPFGVFGWRPPAESILALDDLLATGGRP